MWATPWKLTKNAAKLSEHIDKDKEKEILIMAKKNEKNNDNKLESKSMYVRGILTDAFYGRKAFDKNGKDKYRISIKAVPEDMEALVDAAGPYYEGTDEKWLPKWFTDEDAREFLNLASNFDIKAGYKNPETGKIEELGDLTDYIADHGNINGSKVVLMVTLKEGAIYPASILIKELKQTTIADMFDDFEDLPF